MYVLICLDPMGMPASLTPVLSSLPCRVPASPWGTAWKPEEGGDRRGCGVAEAGAEGRRVDLEAEEESPAQRPPGSPCLRITSI